MKKIVFKVDINGLVVDNYVTEVDENGQILDETKSELISIDPPHGLFKAKWTGTEWIEGATQEEIDELTRIEPQPPSQDDRIKELEMIVNLLLTGGL